MSDEASTNVCSQCGKSFRYRRNLTAHERGHTGTFPYTCYERGFSSQRALERHRCNEHAATQMHVCPTSGKTFSTDSDLKAHEKREKNQRTFCCDICNHHAHTRFELNEHMHSHAEDRSMACRHCGAKYKHRSSLNRHISQRHRLH